MKRKRSRSVYLRKILMFLAATSALCWQSDWTMASDGYGGQQQSDAANEREFSDESAVDEILTRLNESAAKLTAEFQHDFTEGMPGPIFAINGNDTALTLQDEGLKIQHLNGVGVNGIRTCIQFQGDFDVVATFRDLKISIAGTRGRAGIGLLACFENEAQDNLAVYRRDDKAMNETRLAFVHRVLKEDGKSGHAEKNRLHSANAGRLRIARRGDTVYGLFAPSDSDKFLLLDVQKGVSGDVGVQGLRLVMQGGKNMETDVTWTALSVRADRIFGMPAENAESVVERLNKEQQDQNSVRIDFADPTQVDSHCQLDPQTQAVREQSDDGLRLTLISEQSGRSSKITTAVKTPRDFDIAAACSVHQLETPESGARKSEVVMQVLLEEVAELDETTPVEVSLALRPDYRGGRVLIARYVGRNRVRKMIYRPIRDMPVESPGMLRIALRDNKVLFLYAEEQDGAQQVVAEYSVDTPLVAKSVILSTHARGQAYITDVTWKSLVLSGNAD